MSSLDNNIGLDSRGGKVKLIIQLVMILLIIITHNPNCNGQAIHEQAFCESRSCAACSIFFPSVLLVKTDSEYQNLQWNSDAMLLEAKYCFAITKSNWRLCCQICLVIRKYNYTNILYGYQCVFYPTLYSGTKGDIFHYIKLARLPVNVRIGSPYQSSSMFPVTWGLKEELWSRDLLPVT